MTTHTRTTLLLLAAPALLITFAFILPMAQVGWWSFFDRDGLTTEHITVALTDPLFVTVLLQTIVLALQVAVISVLIGYPVAYYLSTMTGTAQRACILLITFPLWVSVLVRTYAWIVVMGREGLINLVLGAAGIVDEPLRMIFTRGAVLVASVQVLVPLAILIMFGAMRQINRTLLRAARVLGAPPHRASGSCPPGSAHGPAQSAAATRPAQYPGTGAGCARSACGRRKRSALFGRADSRRAAGA